MSEYAPASPEIRKPVAASEAAMAARHVKPARLGGCSGNKRNRIANEPSGNRSLMLKRIRDARAPSKEAPETEGRK